MRLLACLFLPAALLAAGCGGGSSGLVPVTGTVTLNDAPLPNALVSFIPTGDTPGQGGTARTGRDGKYALVSPQGEKGIPPGQYRVVVSRPLNPDGSEPDPNVPPIESRAGESLPPEYSDRDATQLAERVSADRKVIDLRLTAAKK